MTFGLTPEKLLLIGLIAVILVGPERLPRYAEGLAKLIRRGADFVRGAKDRVSEEMGPEFTETDWRKLDPRQYDPRRIIREALLDPAPPVTVSAAVAGMAPSGSTAAVATQTARLTAGEKPPFDTEAT